MYFQWLAAMHVFAHAHCLETSNRIQSASETVADIQSSIGALSYN